VRIAYGNAALGPDDGGGVDVAVMDDFIYGEPQAIPEPAAAAAAGAGALALGAMRCGAVRRRLQSARAVPSRST
jgi:hypothetical protein